MAEIEELLGFPLLPSARRYPAHWSGYEGSAVARAIADAQWRASPDLSAETVRFRRRAGPPDGESG